MRPLTRPALEAVVDWLSSPAISRFLDFSGGRQDLSREELTAFLCSPATAVSVIHAGDGKPLGCYVVVNHNGPFRTATGLFLRRPDQIGLPNHREGSFSKSLKRAALRFIFDELGVLSLHVWTVETNKPAILLNRSLGLRECGRMPSAHVIDGKRYDRLLFSMTAEDYAALKAFWAEREGR